MIQKSEIYQNYKQKSKKHSFKSQNKGQKSVNIIHKNNYINEMQVQQLKSQNQLLQQLVETLERQIQSKNSEQNIMIQQLEHIIKDNDSLNTKYSKLLGQSRKWADKQKYFERVIKELQETLAKTKEQLNEVKKNISAQSVPVLNVPVPTIQNTNVSSPQILVPAQMTGHNTTQSSPQIQILSPGSKVPEPMHIPSHLYVSMPKMSIPQQSQGSNNTSFESFSSQPQQSNKGQPVALSEIQKLQSQIKSLKSTTQTLKLQINQKNLQLNSKNQKLHQNNKQLHSLSNEVENLKDLIDDLRKENSELLNEIQQKQLMIKEKDEKFFEIYQSTNEEWRVKFDAVEEERKMLRLNQDAHCNQIEEKDNQLKTIEQELKSFKDLNEQLNGKIVALAREISDLKQKVSSEQQNSFSEENIKLQQEISKLLQDKQIFAQELQRMKQQNENLNKQIENMAVSQIQTLQNQVANLRQSLQTSNQQIRNLEQQNSSSRQSNYSLVEQNLAKSQRIQQLNSQLSNLTQRMSQQKSQSLEHITELKQSLNQAQQSLKKIENEKDSLINQVKQKQQQLLDKEKQHSQVSRQNDSLSMEQINVLQSENSQLKEEVNQFAEKFEQIGVNLEDMKQYISILEEQLATREQELTEKNKEIELLKFKQNELQKQIQLGSKESKLSSSSNISTPKRQTQSKSNNSSRQLPKNPNHVELEMFQLLQNEYTQLYKESQEAKLNLSEQRKTFDLKIKEKQQEIKMLNRKVEDLTKLFTQKTKENQQLRESFQKDRKRQSSGSKDSPKFQDKRFVKPEKYVENFVGNHLSSPRSQHEKISDGIVQDQMMIPNGGFDIHIVPTERKSDLPLHNTEFSEPKQIRPKSNMIQEGNKKEIQIPNEIDINYLRNSIAQFGMDIDFNAIAKHIGLEVDEEIKEERPKSNQKNRVQKHKSLQQDIQNLMSDDKPMIQQDDEVMHSKQTFGKVSHKKGMHSSYGSNPSQKRSFAGGLQIPIMDEELMRSSYGSNNQFTQIVLYYEEEMGKLRQKINELGEEVKEKQNMEKRLYEIQIWRRQNLVILKEKEDKVKMLEKQNEENVSRIQELENILTEMRNELDLKEREEYAKELEEQMRRKQQEQSYNSNNNTSRGAQPQTSEFRTSIEPRIARKQNQKISLTPQEQEETIQLIAQLSTQLKNQEQRLELTEQQLTEQRQKSSLLNTENIQLVKELELLRKDYENLVNQFSELSLHQNNQIVQLTEESTKQSQELTKVRQQNQQLMRINKDLFEEQQGDFQQKIQSLKQELQLNYHTKLQQEKQKISSSYHELHNKNIELETALKEKADLIIKITEENIEKDTELIKVNQQLSAVMNGLQEARQGFKKTLEDKQIQVKKMQKSLKQSKDQSHRLSNQNETLAKEFTKMVKISKEYDNLTKKYSQLEAQNRNLQEALISKVPSSPLAGNQSPIFPVPKQRISDLLEQHTPISQQNFTINNISNIHVLADQLGDDSFILHEKEKQLQGLKEIIEKSRVQNQNIIVELKEKDLYINELEDKLAMIDNSYNSEIMQLKKSNADLNSQLLKLKKQLFSYQKDSGQIDKFIHQNFLLEKSSLQQRFSADSKNQDNFVQSLSQNLDRSLRNNSFRLERGNSNEISTLSEKRRVNMTQYYYPPQRDFQTPMNMGEMFMGRKARPRFNNTENNISQFFRGNNTAVKSKFHLSAVQTSLKKPQSNYGKYLTEYQKYEQKIKAQKIIEPTYGAKTFGHSKKSSDLQNE